MDTKAADSKAARYAERLWHMLIGGDLVTGRTGTTMPVIHPGDESVIARIPLGDAADLPAAVDGALRGMNFRWQGRSCGSTARDTNNSSPTGPPGCKTSN